MAARSAEADSDSPGNGPVGIAARGRRRGDPGWSVEAAEAQRRSEPSGHAQAEPGPELTRLGHCHCSARGGCGARTPARTESFIGRLTPRSLRCSTLTKRAGPAYSPSAGEMASTTLTCRLRVAPRRLFGRMGSPRWGAHTLFCVAHAPSRQWSPSIASARPGGRAACSGNGHQYSDSERDVDRAGGTKRACKISRPHLSAEARIRSKDTVPLPTSRPRPPGVSSAVALL
jgi:hypothetical protein